MRAEIITIGTELLLGEIDDTNATYLARKLREIGVDLYYRTTVGDNERRIAEVIDNALDRVDVVITTGGLGPTVDDVTREGIAQATGRALQFQQALLDQIADRFRRFDVRMSENNRRQAYIPQGAIPIENPVGTAPVFILETERGIVMTLPGVPREMKHLVENSLLPWLAARVESPAVITSVILRTAGIGESQIDARIGDLMTSANPTVGLAAHTGQTDVRITAKAATRDEASAMCEAMAGTVRERLGPWIYGTEAELLEDVVTHLLAGQGASVATVEMGTGGLLADRLCEAQPEHAGRVSCLGAYESLDEWALPGVSASLPPDELAARAAETARDAAGATYGIAVIMRAERHGENGTAIATAGEAGSRVRTFNWLNDRPDAHVWATTHALAMLRRFLLKQAEPGD